MPDIASIFGPPRIRHPPAAFAAGPDSRRRLPVVHLVTNASILDGPRPTRRRVDQIHSLGPLTLFFVEWVFIFLPILFHGLIGLIIVARGKRNCCAIPTARTSATRCSAGRAWSPSRSSFGTCSTPAAGSVAWWIDHVTRPLGGGTFDPEHAGGHRRRRPSRPRRWYQVAYVVGSPGQRLPSGQRPVDDGHHLGRLDQPAPSVGQLALACLASGWRRWAWRIGGHAVLGRHAHAASHECDWGSNRSGRNLAWQTRR